MQLKPLLILLLAFSTLVLLYTLATPLFEAPDEVWHYAYVRWLAEGHGLPSMADDSSGANQEVAQPPLYYALAALLSAPFPDDDLADLRWHNPNFGYQAPGTTPDNKNMLIHTEREHWPWRGAVAALRAARAAAWLFGLLTVASTWGLAHTIYGKPQTAWLAAALVALVPQFVFLSGTVSNDTSAAALSTAALWAAAVIVRDGLTWQRAALAGALAGLATLTKVSALPLAGLIGLALLWVCIRDRDEMPWQRALTTLALYATVVLAVGGWWYARNIWLYGDPLGLQMHTNTLWQRSEPVGLLGLLPELPTVYRSFWGAFGWGHVRYPNAVYVALGLLPLAALAGWWQRRRALPGDGAWATLLLALAWCGGIVAALLRWMLQVEAPHGRLLFPALGAAATLAAGGLQGLIHKNPHTPSQKPLTPKTWKTHFTKKGQRPETKALTPENTHRGIPKGAALLVPLALLTLITPWAVIRPAFAPPRLRDPARVAATVSGPRLDFGGSARLLGISVEPPTVAPGDWLDVRACWTALAPLETDYTVFVQLVGHEQARVGERLTYPGLGRFPTSLWPVDRAFCDTYRFRVEPWAPAPALYDVHVGLYDSETGFRPAVTDAAGHAIPAPVAGQVRVAPPAQPPPPPEHATTYQLGPAIELVGYDLDAPLRPGEPFTVTLHWRATAQPQSHATAFVHLLDPDLEGADAIVAQHDGVPRHGRYPTTAWQPGDLVLDPHVLHLPDAALPSTLTLAVGLYDPATATRLPATDPTGTRVLHDLIILTTLAPGENYE